MTNIIKTEIFEGQDISFKTTEGKTLINLVHTAKCCGITNKDRNGKTSIKFTRVSVRLENILQTDLSVDLKKEISYVMDEIENANDRNSIYMSTWLSKRLALECNSDKAKRYKNFLVDMDEAREAKPVGKLEQYLSWSEDERGIAYFQNMKDSKIAIAAKEEEIAIAAPKVAAHDTYIENEGTTLISDAAKQLGVPLGKFTAFLNKKFIYKLDGKNQQWKPYTKYVTEGLLVVVERFGDRYSAPQTRITHKGINAIYEALKKSRLVK